MDGTDDHMHTNGTHMNNNMNMSKNMNALPNIKKSTPTAMSKMNNM
ncbi:MAG: hypothetical protein WBQ25_09315 [Nitrososphaeraceae archaeon]